MLNPFLGPVEYTIYIKKGIDYKCLVNYSDKNVEFQAMIIKHINAKDIVIRAVVCSTALLYSH